jgi:nicotinamide phosphoribosyltransferase
MIYGEAIEPELYEKILIRMIEMGFCITNFVAGCGSFSQTYHTRDTLKQAFKATAVKINGEWIAIFKDPKTDESGKKSARGLLFVFKEGDNYFLKENCTWEETNSNNNELKTVFKDGNLIRETSLDEIRNKLK